jgi:hypothetical protein
MDQDQRKTLAAQRAEQYAPQPAGGLLMAGLCGAVVASLGDAVVSEFYGWAVHEHLLLAASDAAAGFLIGVAGHKRLAYRSRKARSAELARIDSDEELPAETQFSG